MVKKGRLLTFVVMLLTLAFLVVSCGDKPADDANIKELAQEHFKAGKHFYKVGKKDKAIKEFDMTTRLDATIKEAHYNLAILYRENGQYTDAITSFKEFKRLVETLPEHELKKEEAVLEYVEGEIERLEEMNK